MDPDGTHVVQLTNNSFIYTPSPKWPHDDTQIVFDAGNGGGIRDIFVLNLVNGHIAYLTDSNSADNLYPSWSNDSAKMVFDRNAQVYTMNADGTDMVLVS